jgi:hypothetical protein
MRCSSFTFRWIIKVAAFVLIMSQFSSAQERSKNESPEQQTALRQLHPKAVESEPPKGIKLLAGYKHKGATDFEGNKVGEISKSGGVKIRYEMGFSQGMAVDSDRKTTYVWYREQRVDGRITAFALSTSNTLVISIPFSDDPKSLHVANFYGTIRKPEDIADMLLMVLPLAYKLS